MASLQAAPGTVLITGTTSGVGLYATKALVERGWRVITANRDPLRAEAASMKIGLPTGKSRQLIHIQMVLGDRKSVRMDSSDLLAPCEQSFD